MLDVYHDKTRPIVNHYVCDFVLSPFIKSKEGGCRVWWDLSFVGLHG